MALSSSALRSRPSRRSPSHASGEGTQLPSASTQAPVGGGEEGPARTRSRWHLRIGDDDVEESPGAGRVREGRNLHGVNLRARRVAHALGGEKDDAYPGEPGRDETSHDPAESPALSIVTVDGSGEWGVGLRLLDVGSSDHSRGFRRIRRADDDPERVVDPYAGRGSALAEVGRRRGRQAQGVGATGMRTAGPVLREEPSPVTTRAAVTP